MLITVRLMDFIGTLEKTGEDREKICCHYSPAIPSTYADVSDLISDLDYQPKTSIQGGNNRFVDWYTEVLIVNKIGLARKN